MVLIIICKYKSKIRWRTVFLKFFLQFWLFVGGHPSMTQRHDSSTWRVDGGQFCWWPQRSAPASASFPHVIHVADGVDVLGVLVPCGSDRSWRSWIRRFWRWLWNVSPLVEHFFCDDWSVIAVHWTWTWGPAGVRLRFFFFHHCLLRTSRVLLWSSKLGPGDFHSIFPHVGNLAWLPVEGL